MTLINVVCGLIYKEDKIFISRRRPEKSMGGYWEFPGGKLEPGEDPVAALVRELNEELDMTIANPVFFGAHTHTYDTFTIHLIAYRCDFVSSSFRMTDHDKYTFVTPSELIQDDMAPADMFFVLKLNEDLRRF